MLSVKKYILLLLPLCLSANEDFISHYEYGEMLYANPRGVSCAQCHGERGEGKVIITYKEGKEKKSLDGPDIRRESLSRMIRSVNDYHQIMPRYYLTDEEVKAIYDYIQKKNADYLLQFKESNNSN